MNLLSILFVQVLSLLPTIIMFWKPKEVTIDVQQTKWLTMLPAFIIVAYTMAYLYSKLNDEEISPSYRYNRSKVLVVLDAFTLVYTVFLNGYYVSCKVEQDHILFDYISSLLPPLLACICLWIPKNIVTRLSLNRLFHARERSERASDEENRITINSVNGDSHSENDSSLQNNGHQEDEQVRQH